MTSSLVGSEMCIRDRDMHPPRREEEGRRELLEVHELRLVEGTEAQGAVSYTHLTLPTICSV
eukprot:3029935-Prorocentrum_lima.AAC.1